MMYWNYRVIKHKNKDGSRYFKIHEVYYDEKGNPEMFTEEGIEPMGESTKELKEDLRQMAEAFDAPVLDHDELLAICENKSKKKFKTTREVS